MEVGGSRGERAPPWWRRRRRRIDRMVAKARGPTQANGGVSGTSALRSAELVRAVRLPGDARLQPVAAGVCLAAVFRRAVRGRHRVATAGLRGARAGSTAAARGEHPLDRESPDLLRPVRARLDPLEARRADAAAELSRPGEFLLPA